MFVKLVYTAMALFINAIFVQIRFLPRLQCICDTL